MPEQLTKHPEVTLEELSSAGALAFTPGLAAASGVGLWLAGIALGRRRRRR